MNVMIWKGVSWMRKGRVVNIVLWTAVISFILLFTLLIIIGHTTSFDFYYR